MMETKEHQIANLKDALTFILAGDSFFTLVSLESSVRYTYHVEIKEEENKPPVWFVRLLTGSDNTSDYTYIGYFTEQNGFRTSKATPDSLRNSKAVKAIQWMLEKLQKGATFTGKVAMYHMGRCGRCGRPLTVPESIEAGIGPDCAEKMGAAYGATATVTHSATKANPINNIDALKTSMAAQADGYKFSHAPVAETPQTCFICKTDFVSNPTGHKLAVTGKGQTYCRTCGDQAENLAPTQGWTKEETLYWLSRKFTVDFDLTAASQASRAAHVANAAATISVQPPQSKLKFDEPKAEDSSLNDIPSLD